MATVTIELSVINFHIVRTLFEPKYIFVYQQKYLICNLLNWDAVCEKKYR